MKNQPLETRYDKPKSSKTPLIIIGGIIIVLLIAILIVLFILLGKAESNEAVSSTDKKSITEEQTDNAQKLIGSWQGDQARRGVIFYEDNTCKIYSFGADYYITEDYIAEGNVITICNNETGAKEKWKYSIKGDTLSMTLIETNGKEIRDEATNEYTKVKHLNLKSAEEILQDIAEDANN